MQDTREGEKNLRRGVQQYQELTHNNQTWTSSYKMVIQDIITFSLPPSHFQAFDPVFLKHMVGRGQGWMSEAGRPLYLFI